MKDAKVILTGTDVKRRAKKWKKKKKQSNKRTDQPQRSTFFMVRPKPANMCCRQENIADHVGTLNIRDVQ